MYRDGKPVENTGRVLYTLLQDRVIEQGVYGKENQTLTMKEEYLPNAKVFGAYFDGRHVYQVEDYSIAYRYDERKLSIEITTDADSYRPVNRFHRQGCASASWTRLFLLCNRRRSI